MAKKKSQKQAPTKTNFATMGTEASQVAGNASLSPNLKFQPRGGAKGGTTEPATAGHRQGILERFGHKGAPQVGVEYANAPEAANVGKNVRLVRSAIGNRDFYDKRSLGQTGNFG